MGRWAVNSSLERGAHTLASPYLLSSITGTAGGCPLSSSAGGMLDELRTGGGQGPAFCLPAPWERM